jgi:hypothetical protein
VLHTLDTDAAGPSVLGPAIRPLIPFGREYPQAAISIGRRMTAAPSACGPDRVRSNAFLKIDFGYAVRQAVGNRAANVGIRSNGVGSMYARYDSPPAANRKNRMKQPSIVTKRAGEITWRINPDWPEYEIATIVHSETKIFYQLNAMKVVPYKGPTEWSVVRNGRLIAEGFEPSLDDARIAAVGAYTSMRSGPRTPWTRPPVEKPKRKLPDSTTSCLLMCVGVIALFFDANTAGLSILFWLVALVIWICEPSGIL